MSENVTPPSHANLADSEAVTRVIAVLRKTWQEQIKCGTFIFDIDETLLPPDAFLNQSKIKTVFMKLLATGMPVALMSGGPGAFVKKRISDCLKKEAGKSLQNLTIYANGGSSLFRHSASGELVQDQEFTATRLIPAAQVLKVKRLIENYIEHQFYLSDDDFQRLMDGWREKRNAQWKDKPIDFREVIFAPSVQLDLLEDEIMAEVKSGESRASVSYPFINTRLSTFNGHKQLVGVAGFTPTGFYAFKKSKGDDRDLDLRDLLLDRLQEDLGPDAEALVMRKAGRSSIDIVKEGADKAAAVEHFLKEKQRDAEKTYYFGDEFFAGGNDEPVWTSETLRSGRVQFLGVNQEIAPGEGVLWIGRSPVATQTFLEKVLS